MPNIITGENIVPELVQSKAKPDLIAYNIEKLLYDEQYREQNIAELQKVKELLSEKYSAYEVAQEIKNL